MKQSKFTLLIDMDGVLVQWYAYLLSLYQAKYPDRTTIAPEDLKHFYVEDAYPEGEGADMMGLALEKGFYRNLPPMPGAVAALKDIEENCLDFIEPFICTAPELDFENLGCHSEKVQSVREHFGDFWVRRTIITKDKTLVRGNALIDDKPTITGAMTPVWTHLHYKQPYNENVEGRLTESWFTWEQWPRLKAIIQQGNQRWNYLNENY